VKRIERVLAVLQAHKGEFLTPGQVLDKDPLIQEKCQYRYQLHGLIQKDIYLLRREHEIESRLDHGRARYRYLKSLE
jgi:hypothetical protein